MGQPDRAVHSQGVGHRRPGDTFFKNEISGSFPQPPRGMRRVGADLLNARWHRLRARSDNRCCGGCLEVMRIDEHAVRRAGEVFHPQCALYEPPSTTAGSSEPL